MPDQVEYVTLYNNELVYGQATDGTSSYAPATTAGYCIWRWALPNIEVRNRSGIMMVSLEAVNIELGTADVGYITTRNLVWIDNSPQNARSCKNNYPMAAALISDAAIPDAYYAPNSGMQFVMPANTQTITLGMQYMYNQEFVDMGTEGGCTIVLKLVYPDQDRDQLGTSLIKTFDATMRV